MLQARRRRIRRRQLCRHSLLLGNQLCDPVLVLLLELVEALELRNVGDARLANILESQCPGTFTM
jgi:hypothetical protein